MIPAPILNIETTHFYVHGLEAGAYLFKNEQHRVMLGISYMPLEFDASDSDDNRMKQLDDRDASAFAALSYSYTHPLVTVSAKLKGRYLRQERRASCGRACSAPLPNRTAGPYPDGLKFFSHPT